LVLPAVPNPTADDRATTVRVDTDDHAGVPATAADTRMATACPTSGSRPTA
jgi:hypothetical protein